MVADEELSADERKTLELVRDLSQTGSTSTCSCRSPSKP